MEGLSINLVKSVIEFVLIDNLELTLFQVAAAPMLDYRLKRAVSAFFRETLQKKKKRKIAMEIFLFIDRFEFLSIEHLNPTLVLSMFLSWIIGV